MGSISLIPRAWHGDAAKRDGVTASPGGTRAKIEEITGNLHVARVEIKTVEIKTEDSRIYLPCRASITSIFIHPNHG